MRMRRALWLAVPLVVSVLIGVGLFAACARFGDWTSVFLVEKDELLSVGRNPYFILEPGYRLVLEGDGAQLIITVVNETKKVDGVETRVVEERETKGGKLVEVARNYFAISKRTNDVFYSEKMSTCTRTARSRTMTGRGSRVSTAASLA